MRVAMGHFEAQCTGAPEGRSCVRRSHQIFNAFLPMKTSTPSSPDVDIRPATRDLRDNDRQGGSSSWPTMTTTCRSTGNVGQRLFPFGRANERISSE